MNGDDTLDEMVPSVLDPNAFDEPDDDDRLTGLRDAVARRAHAAGDLDVAYRLLDSPIGPLLVAVTTAGLCRVAFDVEGHDAVVDELARRVGSRVLRAPGRLDAVARELDGYFAGAAHALTVPVDLRLASGFRRTVLERLARVPYGQRIGYGALAAAVGNPGAARAVGTACATNPIPLVVPCHRVVRGDGTYGAYRGGPDAKRYLLEFEAAQATTGTTGTAHEAPPVGAQ